MTLSEIRRLQEVAGWGISAIAVAVGGMAGVIVAAVQIGQIKAGDLMMNFAATGLMAWAFDINLYDEIRPHRDLVDALKLSMPSFLSVIGLAVCFVVVGIHYRRARAASDGRGLVEAIRFLAHFSQISPSPINAAGLRTSARVVASFLSRELRILFAPAQTAVAAEPSDDDIRAAIAHALTAARKRAAMTQTHLALAADLSLRTVQRAEKSGRVSFENLRGISSVLQIPVPVPEGRQSAANEPSAWRCFAKPVLIGIVVALGGFLSMGWWPSTWRGRGCHMLASTCISAVIGITYRHWIFDPAPFGNPGVAEIGLALTAAPIAMSAAGILVGCAWRSKHPSASIGLTLLAAVSVALPSVELARAASDFRISVRQNEVAYSGQIWMREMTEMVQGGAPADCMMKFRGAWANSWVETAVGEKIGTDPIETYARARLRMEKARTETSKSLDDYRQEWKACMAHQPHQGVPH